MSFLELLHTLLIGSLELLFEYIYSFAYRYLQNPGLAIIALSITVNLLVLPLYRRADAMQEQERQTEAGLQKWVRHIKRNFKGDERFMILQTYYRQNNYKPTDILKGSISLLLEIPFFMAAYGFLSGLGILQGVGFGPIADLSKPDGLVRIGAFTINVLPVAMTLINLVSSAIYTKGLSFRSKLQLYAMAAIFLILLYDSPSGLVFYWTLNNLFSLVKNLFYRLKNPKAVILWLLAGCGMALFGARLSWTQGSIRRWVILLAESGVLILPLVWDFLYRKKGWRPILSGVEERPWSFYLGSILITVLTGILIPSAVVANSPEEFLNIATGNSPLIYVFSAGVLSAGIFLVWGNVFYYLMGPAGKKMAAAAIWIFCGISLTDYMFFGKGYGNLTTDLRFVMKPVPREQIVLNFAVLAVIVLVLAILWMKKAEWLRTMYLSAILALSVMSCINLVQIHRIASDKMEQLNRISYEEPEIPLSEDGQNVMVIMMDRAISAYIPYIMNEKPELLEQFDGFTYYPNTVSYGPCTNAGAPALFGGYEYTPYELNRRDQELLEEKHNEAMKVMPVLFNQAGFEVTVCDPTYAGYDWIPDLSIYDDYPDIHRYNLPENCGKDSDQAALEKDLTRRRNFFCYSIMKIAPVKFHYALYDSGRYHQLGDASFQMCTGNHTAVGMETTFIKPYEQLKMLPRITTTIPGDQKTFVMLTNNTTHDPMMLQEPAYEPANQVDNRAYEQTHGDRFCLNGQELKMDNTIQIAHYQSNMAAMIQLGKWFDELRNMGVYDNTRIIIAADHGHSLMQIETMIFGEGSSHDAMRYNPLLMVKDFQSKGFSSDERFMTNADVPTLATDGLIQEPVNPFTGCVIDSSPKNRSEQMIFYTTKWNVQENNGYQFLPGEWFSVSGNVLDGKNWKEIPEPDYKSASSDR